MAAMKAMDIKMISERSAYLKSSMNLTGGDLCSPCSFSISASPFFFDFLNLEKKDGLAGAWSALGMVLGSTGSFGSATGRPESDIVNNTRAVRGLDKRGSGTDVDGPQRPNEQDAAALLRRWHGIGGMTVC